MYKHIFYKAESEPTQHVNALEVSDEHLRTRPCECTRRVIARVYSPQHVRTQVVDSVEDGEVPSWC
jgi:hypothetical protein